MSNKRGFELIHPNFADQPEDPREFSHGFTPRDFAKIHQVHMNTVYRWIGEGLIKAKKITIWQRHRYQISMYAVPPRLKPGPVPRPRDD